jgi:hypothetical protein
MSTNDDIKESLEKDLRLLPPTNDLLARKFLTSPGYENITLGFIRDFLDFDIDAVVVIDPYSIESYKAHSKQGMRQTVVDVLATISSGIQVAIEIQVGHMAGFDKRALYGLCTRYAANLGCELDGTEIDKVSKKPKTNEAKYIALKPVYGINVIKDNYFVSDNDAYRSFELYDKEHNSGYGHGKIDLFRMVFFELSKKNINGNSNLLYWSKFFNGAKIDDGAPDYIKQAASIVDRHNLTAEEAEMVTAEQLVQMDIDARIDWATADGERRGEARGRRATARNLVRLGLPTKDIQKATGLSQDEINSLT